MFSFFRKRTLEELIAAGRFYLVQHRVNAENCSQPDEHGLTPMHYALEHQQARIVGWLLSLGCELEGEANSLMDRALASKAFEMVEVLAGHGVPLPESLNGLPLLHALVVDPEIKEEHIVTLQKTGVDINQVDTRVTGMSALAWYVSQQDIRVNTLQIRWMIKCGADVNVASEPVKTPLWQALMNSALTETQESMSVTRFDSVLKELLKGDLDLSPDLARYGYDCLALQLLYQGRNEGFIDLLEAGMPVPEESKAKIGSYLDRGRFSFFGAKKLLEIDQKRGLQLPVSILLYAIPAQRKIVDALTAGDPRIHVMFSDLVCAVNYQIKDKLAILGTLLEKGADINTPGAHGEYTFSPLQAAIVQHAEIPNIDELAAWLLEKGAAIECQGYSALHLAVATQSTTLARMLVNHGADLHWQDVNNGTVLSWVVSVNPWCRMGNAATTSLMLRQLNELWRSKGETLPLMEPLWYNDEAAEAFSFHDPIGVIFARYRPRNTVPMVTALLDIGLPLNGVMTTKPHSGNIISFMLRWLKPGEDLSPLLDALPETLDVNSAESGDPLHQAMHSMASPQTIKRLLPLIDDLNRVARYPVTGYEGMEYMDRPYLINALACHSGRASDEIKAWQLDVCRVLLEHGADASGESQLGPMAANDRGFVRRALTALEWAVCERNFELFVLLLNAGADPHRKTCVKQEQLVHFLSGRASFMTCEEIIRYLDELEQRGLLDVHTRQGQNSTPLLTAVSKSQTGLVRYFLERGAKVDVFGGFDNSGVLHRAISNWDWVNKDDRRDTLTLLLNAGADPNLRDPDGDVPLTMAACYGALTSLETLLAHGADPKLARSNGRTALHEAVTGAYGYDNYPDDEHCEQPNVMDVGLKVAIIDLLLAHGAELDAVDEEGDTPLVCAMHHQQPELFQVLLARGADVNRTDIHGRTPLMQALQYGAEVFIDTLLAQPLVVKNIAAEANNGSNVLHAICLRQAADDVGARYLALQQMDGVCYRANQRGITPLHYAACNGHLDIVLHCCERGVDVNAVDDNGYTPLHTALFFDEHDVTPAQVMQIVTSLITAGADPLRVDSSGETPLMIASRRNLNTIVTFMTRISGLNAASSVSVGLSS